MYLSSPIKVVWPLAGVTKSKGRDRKMLSELRWCSTMLRIEGWSLCGWESKVKVVIDFLVMKGVWKAGDRMRVLREGL